MIEWTTANYPVLNERSVRATAWIMFFIGMSTVFYSFFTKDYILLQIVLPLFFINFIILVLWGPKYSPLSFLGRILVQKQKPEFVWAIQKRFAWWLWLIMSWIVMLIVFGFQITWWIPLTLCGICLLLMWMESSLWVCVGCNIYSLLLDKKIIATPMVKPACPGWVCSLKK